jgi:hypothetical protein
MTLASPFGGTMTDFEASKNTGPCKTVKWGETPQAMLSAHNAYRSKHCTPTGPARLSAP